MSSGEAYRWNRPVDENFGPVVVQYDRNEWEEDGRIGTGYYDSSDADRKKRKTDEVGQTDLE